MAREDYCSFELSKLLKEKGFDEYCRSFYELREPRVYVGSNGVCNNTMFQDESNECIARPTHQMAMKWLREVHKIDIFIDTDFPIDRMKYTYKIVRIYKDGDKYTDVMGGSFDTYEEAVEAAIKYSLENLV